MTTTPSPFAPVGDFPRLDWFTDDDLLGLHALSTGVCFAAELQDEEMAGAYLDEMTRYLDRIRQRVEKEAALLAE